MIQELTLDFKSFVRSLSYLQRLLLTSLFYGMLVIPIYLICENLGLSDFMSFFVIFLWYFLISVTIGNKYLHPWRVSVLNSPK